ncbi:hypothetical protein CHARACLAT_023992 [Characodon lateralis]|uniref:Uncharacterized protein n=1 Tax=Characodon lateralis TaxID=208331 RepID=A0ABU7D3B8_9TELE|nr:hypothetical protein [Characodon lateralis]
MVRTSLQQLPHPSFCQHMPALDWLDLEGNQIQTLNYSILKTCSKLEVLLLMDNRITGVPENTFQSLWKLAELKETLARCASLILMITSVEEAGCRKSGAFIWTVTSQEVHSYPVSWLCWK